MVIMICPCCGSSNPDTNKFCGQCGSLISSTVIPGASGEERKQVTVVFCDVSGYTAMSERLDSEEVRDIMQRIFSATAAIVKKYTGTIDKFIGDCVMVVFGLPQAHEDDPVRAIHAALDIHAAVEELIKAGRKSMASFAAKEADTFYRQAYELITETGGRNPMESEQLIRLLNDWALAHYTLTTFAAWCDIFSKHVEEADSIPDKSLRAMFFAGLGYSCFFVLEAMKKPLNWVSMPSPAGRLTV